MPSVHRKVFLIDINVLIARCDPAHEHYETVAAWFAEHRSVGWATCPLTENGFVRIVGNPAYPNCPGSPGAALEALQALIGALPNHCFFADEISLRDSFAFPDFRGITSRQVTDYYLLALAVHHGANFLTLDRGIDPRRIPGGPAALVVVGESGKSRQT